MISDLAERHKINTMIRILKTLFQVFWAAVTNDI